MDSRLTVRTLCAADRERWDELWNGYLEYYRHSLPPEITEHTWRRLLDPEGELYGLVALDARAHVIGIVHYLFHPSTWSVNGYCYLEDLFVDPAARGLGAGRALIEAVFRAADARGASRVYWNTEHDNTRARALYDGLATLTPFVQYRRQ